MHRKCSESGKLQQRLVTAAMSRSITGCRLFVTDRLSQRRFLVDTGSDLSIYPVKLCTEQRTCTDYELSAANDSRIRTYGTLLLRLQFGLPRDFLWRFIVADVTEPIIGADFLTHFQLIPNMATAQLIDAITGHSTSGHRGRTYQDSVRALSGSSSYHDLLAEFPDITRPSGTPREIHHHTKHHIRLQPGPPIYHRARRLAPDRLRDAQAEFELLVREGTVRRSHSPYASPLHMVRKKDSSWRPCGDYRALNARTIPDRYPVRHLKDFSHALQGCNIFSVIDCAKAFTQIPMAPEDIEKTAIITPFGLFEFLFMPFGLRNAAQTWQRFIDEALEGLNFCFPYIDDILVFSRSQEEHHQHLRILFQRLSDYGVIVNSAKCVLGSSKVTFLGFHVSADGCSPLPDKVAAINNFPPPKTIKDLRRFLGMLNFYRQHIPHAASTQAPLNALLQGPDIKSSTPIFWTPELQQSFDASKGGLAQAATLSHPIDSAPLALVVDASRTAIGAVLQQFFGNSWQPLGFFSRKLTPSQQKWSTYDRELYAAYQAVRHFRPMVEARDFAIFTDHKPLSYAFGPNKRSSDTCSPRQFNHLEFISQFTTDVRHISGLENVVADCLSRVESISTPSPIDFAALSRSQDEDEELQRLRHSGTALQLHRRPVPGTNISLWCDTSMPTPRPYVTPSYRRQIFDNIHSLSHPGANSTIKLVSRRYVWPSMRKDCRAWARSCLSCQRCKVSRHITTPLGDFVPPTRRFEHVHMDIVGPLPSCSGYRYLLTIIDRFSRWPVAEPLADITADSVSRAFLLGWVAHYGCPQHITCDRGRQFVSSLFQRLCTTLGTTLHHTTSYHPQANGLVERLHRVLKAALMCSSSNSWMDALPTVLLGLRTTWRADLQTTPAELLFGEQLRLPGDFFVDSAQHLDSQDLVSQLRNHMSQLRPTPASRHISSQRVFIHKDLATSSQVFVRQDALRPALQPPYAGPYPVLSRGEKTYTLYINGKPATISIDRLKPAHLLEEDRPPTPSPDTTTRSGRAVRPPDRFVANTLSLFQGGE